jgi:HAD superfamily hydrolase (TIGR01509 family)
MPALIDFAAFIFDMDGLVLDTEPTYFAAWHAAVEVMGYKIEPENFLTLSGCHYLQVETTLQSWLGQDFDLQSFKRFATECWLNHIREQGIGIKPGVIDLLDYAQQKGIPACLATNSSTAYAKECLFIAGLVQRFPLILTGDDVATVKPSPEIFLKSAGQMGVDISHCVIFEDSHTGVVAASKSGAYTVYVPSTYPVKPLTVELCDCMLDDLTQVFETFT